MFGKIAASAAKRYGSEERGKKVAGAVLAKLRKMDEAEELEELSKSTLGSYVKKASRDVQQNTYRSGLSAARGVTNEPSISKTQKRQQGIAKAVNKLTSEDIEQTNEAQTSAAARYAKAKMSHQASTTMKHVANPTAGEKQAAKDIKPGVAGYRDRVAMLKSAKARGALKEQEIDQMENITLEFVIENTVEVSIPSTITYQDYINAIKTIVNSDDPEIQAEIVKIANEAFTNENIEVIAEAELIKQGIIEADYKSTRMGHKEFSPELNMDVDRTKPGVTKVSRRIRSGEGKGTTATERRTMKRIAASKNK